MSSRWTAASNKTLFVWAGNFCCNCESPRRVSYAVLRDVPLRFGSASRRVFAAILVTLHSVIV